MYSKNDKISISQMISISILTMVGVGVLALPRGLIQEVGTDGWLLLIVGGLVTMAIAFGHGYIIKTFPGKGFYEILSLTLTRPIAYILCLYMILYFIGMTGYVLRMFGMVLRAFLLPRTPAQLLALSMVFLSTYLVRGGIEVLGRMAETIIVPLGAIILTIFAISWGEVELGNLLPVFQASPLQIIQALPFVIFSFLGFELLLIFGGFLEKPNKSTKVGPWAILITLLLYLLLNASVLANLGAQQVDNLIWPLLTSFKTIELPGAFIENVEAVVMTIWIVIVFTTMAPFHLGAILLIKELFGGKEHSYYALLPIPLTVIISLWDDSVADAYESLDKFIDYTAYGVVFLIPLGILLSIAIKRRKKKKDEAA